METKEKIFECAIKIFLEQGYEGFSMRKVATCVGITATAIYRHYKDKNHLLSEIVSSGFDLMRKHLEINDDVTKNPEDRLLDSLMAYKDFCLKNKEYYIVMFMVRDDINYASISADDNSSSKRALFYLADICKTYLEMKKSDIDYLMFTTHIWSHIHGILSLYIMDRMNFIEIDSFYAGSIKLLLEK